MDQRHGAANLGQPCRFLQGRNGPGSAVGPDPSSDGPGGDAACGGAGPDNIEDATAFILPEAYRPANDEVRIAGGTGGGTWLIVGSTPIAAPGLTIPAGAVLDLSNIQSILLDGESVPRRRHRQRIHSPRCCRSGDVAAAIAELVG